jgi:hypothetical protein
MDLAADGLIIGRATRAGAADGFRGRYGSSYD